MGYVTDEHQKAVTFDVDNSYPTLPFKDRRNVNLDFVYKQLLDGCPVALLQSVSWILAEFYFSRGLQRLYTSTCIILQETINGFLCLLIVFLKSKTYQLILKDVIKLNRNLR